MWISHDGTEAVARTGSYAVVQPQKLILVSRGQLRSTLLSCISFTHVHSSIFLKLASQHVAEHNMFLLYKLSDKDWQRSHFTCTLQSSGTSVDAKEQVIGTNHVGNTICSKVQA